MNNTITLVNRLDCTGCGACLAICPVNAIKLVFDNEGFLFPVIDECCCVLCGRCYAICPTIHTPDRYINSEFRVVQLKNEEALSRSSSGGAFYGLALRTLEQGGTVFGCALNSEAMPVHIRITHVEDLRSLQGSKYVQSQISPDIYREVKSDLDTGKRVLFSGTPCQVAGLRNFLGETNNNLITLDVICHGVASPGLWRHYVATMESKIGKKVVNAHFRDRQVGKHPNNHSILLVTEDGIFCQHALSNPFGASYYHNRILRECCYRCAFAQMRRVSDISLGDYNCKGQMPQSFQPDKGYSIVLVSSSIGQNVMRNSEYLFAQYKVSDGYSQINLEQPTLRPRSRDRMKRMSYHPEDPIHNISYNFRVTTIDQLKKLLPQKSKDFIKKLLRKRG